jgi:hypothetical protein
MRNKIPLILLAGILLIMSPAAYAQFKIGGSFGYNGNRLFRSLRNLEIPIHQFNIDNPQFEKEYKLPAFGQGFFASFNLGGKGAGIDFIYKNNHGIAEAKGIPIGDTRVFLKRIKYRQNLFGLGPYFNLGHRGNLRFGIIMDFGTFGVFKKSAPENEFKQKQYEKFYTKNAVVFGGTFYLKYSIRVAGPVCIAIQPYIDWLTNIKSPTFTVGYSENTYYYDESSFGMTIVLELRN